ncbi:unnamed protein product [Closterium sp. NIES-54]
MTGTDSGGANGEMAGVKKAGEQGGVAGGGVGTHQPANPMRPPMYTQYKLLDLVEGKEKMPEAAELKGAWLKRSFDAYMLMVQAVGGRQLDHIKDLLGDPECASKAWRRLLDVHSPTHATGIVLLARPLRDITKLQGGGVVYPELVQCVEIVIRLLESWSAIAINLNSQQPQRSVDYIRARIIEEDLRRRSVERSVEGAGYGVGGGKSGFKKKWKGKNKDNPKEDGGMDQGVIVQCVEIVIRLLESWSAIAINLNSQQPQRSVDYVRARIIEEDLRRRSVERSVEGAGYGVGGGKSGFKKKWKGKNKDNPKGWDEEKGGKSEERDKGATGLAMAAKVLLHPLTHWVIDPESSWHMTPRVDLLDEIQPAPISKVTSATGAKAKVMGMWCAKFMGADGELVGLKNVLWVPDLCANLISTGRLGDAGVNIETIGSERYRAYNDERLIWDLQR